MRSKVLIVDDMEVNREMLAAILSRDYPLIFAGGGRQAVEIISRQHDEIAVVLLDLLMPDMDGYAVLDVLRKKSWMDKIPVLIISIESRADVEHRCFEMGVSDFIRKPFDNEVVRNRVKNVVDLFTYKNQLEDKVDRQTETLKKQYRQLVRQAEKLKESNTRIIDLLGTVVECRNLESGQHIQRVKAFTRILAEQAMADCPEYGLTWDKIDVIVAASPLHDIGKIAIPDGILLKPARLTPDEFDYMKTHTIRGCEILDSIQDAWDEIYSEISYEICRYHHERYDGKGYPDGLTGEDIPISAQLVSIADVYDALVSERVYKAPYTAEEAYHMVLDGECGVFSPKLLACFRKVRSKFEEQAKK